MIGIIAFNLIPQYKKLMMKEISADYFEKNKVDVYAPELASLHYCRNRRCYNKEACEKRRKQWLEWEKIEQRCKLWDNKRAEEKKLWDAKRVEKKKLLDNKLVEEKIIWDDQRVEEKKLWDNKEAGEKKLLDDKKAAEKKLLDNKKAAPGKKLRDDKREDREVKKSKIAEE